MTETFDIAGYVRISVDAEKYFNREPKSHH